MKTWAFCKQVLVNNDFFFKKKKNILGRKSLNQIADWLADKETPILSRPVLIDFFSLYDLGRSIVDVQVIYF